MSMPRYDHRKCEDDQDATRMAEVMRNELKKEGFNG
jgi:hypothetical protein